MSAGKTETRFAVANRVFERPESQPSCLSRSGYAADAFFERRRRPPQSASKPEPSKSSEDGSGAVTVPGANFTSIGRSVKLSVKNVNDDGSPGSFVNVKAAELPLSSSVKN
jgi:hypothetical protein